MKSILDFHPVNYEVLSSSGPEPTLRDMVFRYYDLYIEDSEHALILARDYCKQIEHVELMRKEADLK